MARHDRGYLRFQRDRIIAKRKGFLKRWCRSENADYWLNGKHENQFAKKHPLDCGRSNCGVCRNNWDEPSRSRRKREWKKIEDQAY